MNAVRLTFLNLALVEVFERRVLWLRVIQIRKIHLGIDLGIGKSIYI